MIKNDNEELLICPCCGGVSMIDKEGIFCNQCHLSMRIDDRLYSKEAETYEEARTQTINAWNTRKPMDKIVEKLESDKRHTFDGCINKKYAIDVVKESNKVCQ